MHVFYLLCILFFILCSWLETNTPHYYSECVRVLGPLMEKGLEKTKSAAIFISENTAQFILWVKEKTPQAIEWVRLLLADFRIWWDRLNVTHILYDWLVSCPLCFCPGEQQYTRQCVRDVGVFKGAPPLPLSELHSASTGVHIWPATTSMDQPTGVLQVSSW